MNYRVPTPQPGARFGRWTVLAPGRLGYRKRYLICRCDCGTERTVDFYMLRMGRSASCGCGIGDSARRTHLVHGDAPDGDAQRLYRIWRGLKQRCINPNAPEWENYGGRGIRVCAEWDADYPAFKAWALANGYTDDLQIDRADNDGPYSPSNCRWVTGKANSRNTRRTRLLTIFGETKCMAEWGEDPRCAVAADTIATRLHRGWDPEVALITPKQKGKKPPTLF